MTVEKQLHSQRDIVQCDILSRGITRPFLSGILAGQALIGGALWSEVIDQFTVPKLQDIDDDDMWFPQDGASEHTVSRKILLE